MVLNKLLDLILFKSSVIDDYRLNFDRSICEDGLVDEVNSELN
jgi:hypothetical protein